MITKTSNIFGFMASQNMSEASIYIVGGGSPMISTISISIGNHCNLQNLLHLAYPRSKHRSNILNSCWSCNKTNRYGIYIYMYIYICGSRLQVATMPYTRDLQSIKGASGPLGIFFKLQAKPAPSSNETGNQLKNRFQSNLQMFICVY